MEERFSVWSIETDADYVAWLEAVQAKHPRLTKPVKGLRKGDSTVGRTTVLAEDRDGVMHLGVRLSTDDEFWKPSPANFNMLLNEQIIGGIVFEGGKGAHTVDRIDALIAEHGPVQRLEFCSAPEGSVTVAIMRDGERIVVDEG